MSGNFDAEQSRYDRMNRTNPSEYAPGQNPMTDVDSMFNNSVSQPVGNGFGDAFGGMQNSGGMFGGTNGGGMPGMMNGMPQQQQSAEDKFWDAASKGAKGTKNFFVDIANSGKTVTPKFWHTWGYQSTLTGVVVAGVGFVLRLFGVKFGLKITIGGLMGMIPAVMVWLMMTDKAKEESGLYKDSPPQDAPASPMPAMDMGSWDNGTDSFDDMGEDEDDVGIAFDDEDDFDDDDFDFDNEQIEPQAGMSTEEALATMQVIDKGMYTRQYLYDMFTKVLPTVTPNYYTEKSYDEEDDVFLYWGDKLREAATVCGVKDDCLPELLELSENLFTVRMKCDRPPGFKPDNVADELSKIYAFDNGLEGVAFKAEPVGMECYITIFTGKNAMISLRDMMLQEESWVLDSKNYMPVIVGVDTSGKVAKVDFKILESVIITGMPRSGKSWFVKCILLQMCMFVSPRELHVYICDPKDGISDFASFALPHVKKFVAEDNEVLNTLRNLIKVEAPRRKKIIGDAGFVNIWDYKKKYPDVELPIVYVLIDEIVTLASRMDKETNQEFRMLLRELISQLPALGIRAFLIPHILNNDIIEKKTSDLVKFRVSICGDADHIEKATGSKPRDFPYKLTNKGDMAVRLTDVSPNTMFLHAPIITPENDANAEIFEYAMRVWGKLEPDEVKTSVAQAAEVDLENKKMLEEIDDDSLDDLFQF